MQPIKNITYNTLALVEAALEINSISQIVNKVQNTADKIGCRTVRISCGRAVGHTDVALHFINTHNAVLVVGNEKQKKMLKDQTPEVLHWKIKTLNEASSGKITGHYDIAILDACYVLSKMNPESILHNIKANQYLVLG